MFVGRERELGVLNRRYDSGKFEFVPVYGRRRVGKTALLKEFCKGKNAVFYTASSGSLEYNMSGLASMLFGAKVHADLDIVLDKIRELSEKERFLLVIDEYPRLIRKAPEFQDRLQEMLDDIHGASKLFLVLCGSSISIMEHQVLGYSSPLYGRRTGSLNLKPLDLWTSMEMLSGFDRDDALSIYGMVGGIPLYLQQFDPSISLRDNISHAFLDEDSFFANEHTLTLIEEFDNPATYYTVIEAVASGNTKVSDVAQFTGLDGPTVATHLKTLEGIGIVAKDRPVDNPDGKKTLYRVSDPFMRFQLGRVLPMRRGIFDPYELAGRILEMFATDMGAAFEGMCSEYLVARFGGVVGKWWGSDPETRRQEEIDVVITLGPGDGIFAECKYKTEAAGRAVLDTLIHRSMLVRGYSKRRYVLFSKGGFSSDLIGDDVLLLTVDDVLKRPVPGQ